MVIKHGFGYRSHDIIGLFNNTNKLNTFMYKLEKQSLMDPLRYDCNKYKGDGFEFLVEILLKSHAYDNRLGITEYESVKVDDNGVDGVGINLSGDKCVVQIKYRSDQSIGLNMNDDKLSNMVSDGMFRHGVYADENKLRSISEKKTAPVHYVITTANGLHHYTDNNSFKGYVHCIGHEQLRSMLDNNISFWNLCRKISKEIIIKQSNKNLCH